MTHVTDVLFLRNYKQFRITSEASFYKYICQERLQYYWHSSYCLNDERIKLVTCEKDVSSSKSVRLESSESISHCFYGSFILNFGCRGESAYFHADIPKPSYNSTRSSTRAKFSLLTKHFIVHRVSKVIL